MFFQQAGRQGSCEGDSGGPLVIFDTSEGDGFHIQVGLVHGAVGDCGDSVFPGIFVRIENYEVLSFINKHAFGKESLPSNDINDSDDDVVDVTFNDSHGNYIEYKGQVNENNVGHGNGTGYFPNLSVPGTYKGSWKDGDMDGYGEMNWTNGNWYKGGWKKGQWHGRAITHKGVIVFSMISVDLLQSLVVKS